MLIFKEKIPSNYVENVLRIHFVYQIIPKNLSNIKIDITLK